MRQVDGRQVEETIVLPESAPHHNEGKTVAAWTLTVVTSLGTLLAAIGMVLSNAPLLWVGVVVAVAGLALGAVLRAVGLGQPRSATSDGRGSD